MNAQHTVYVWQLLITMGCKDARKRQLSLQDLLFTTSNFMLWPPILGCGGCFREFKSITQPNCLALGGFLVILNNKSKWVERVPFWNKASHLLFFSSLPPPLVTHRLLPNNSALTLQRITWHQVLQASCNTYYYLHLHKSFHPETYVNTNGSYFLMH